MTKIYNETLPKPLSEIEERTLFKKLNESNDEKARELLIMHNMRFVLHLAKKFCKDFTLFEDIISVGSLGLMKAVDNFDINKGIKFSTFASKCIENEILMFYRHLKKRCYDISLEVMVSTKTKIDDANLILRGLISSNELSPLDNIEDEDQLKEVYKVIDKLNDRDKKIIELRFGLYGNRIHSQGEVAKIFNLSQSYISRVEKKILENIKQEVLKYIL